MLKQKLTALLRDASKTSCPPVSLFPASNENVTVCSTPARPVGPKLTFSRS